MNNVLSIPAKVAYDFIFGRYTHVLIGMSGSANRLAEKGVKLIDCPSWHTMPEGFFKVDESNPSTYQHCGCFNPTTMEYFEALEWDYEDSRVDDNVFRETSIDPNSEAFAIWFNLFYMDSYLATQKAAEEEARKKALIPNVGDMAKVVKGRTLPKGTTGKVTKIWEWSNPWGGGRTKYALLDGEKKIRLVNIQKI